MKGHIRPRGKKSWELKFDAGRNPATGERKIQYHSFRGTKRAAQDKLSELLASIGKGDYVEPSKLTVAQYLRSRVAQWEAARLISPSEGISPRTAERYRELIENQIIPHIGENQLQKLRAPDIEAW